MENGNFANYVKSRYLKQIDWYARKARENQKKYYVLQWSLLILAAMTPVLIEFGQSELVGKSFGHLATLTSVIVAILTAALKTFKYQENWINYRTTCETLKKEKYFYDAKIGEYQSADSKEALFVERVESMISRENTLWISAHKSETKSKK